MTDAEHDRALDEIFDTADDLCHAGDWGELDRRLAAVDVEAVTPSMMLSWLAVTLRAFQEGHLTEWVGLTRRVEAELNARGRPVGALMRAYLKLAEGAK